MYRKFSLINGNNQMYSLNGSDVFFSNPSGLGLKATQSVLRQGQSEQQTYEMFNFIDITGEIVFYSNTNAQKYTQFEDFVKFIVIKPLHMVYDLPNGKQLWREITITSLDKGEISKDGILRCNISIHPLGFWEDLQETTVTISQTSTSLTFNNTLDTPFIVEITGDVTNPSYSLSQSNVEYGYCAFTGAYDYIYVDSNEVNETIELQLDGSSIANPYSKQTFTDYATKPNVIKTFLKAKQGTSTFTLGSAFNNFSGTIKIKYRNRYVSI